MTLQIKKASKAESKLRMALVGPSGSGKTFTGLSIGSELGQKILVVDTESGSASKYADIFNFDVIELSDFAPERFIESIALAEQNGYDVIILDSLSHEWNGKGGILEIHEAEAKRGGNSYTAWAKVTPRHNALIQAVINSKLHVISTMRAKTDYSIEKDDKGRTQVKTVGLAPVQRDGMEYEYDVVAQIDIENNMIVQKTRCPALSGKVFPRAGAQVAEILKIWLAGEKPPTVVKMPEPVKATQPAPQVTAPPQTRTDELQQHQENAQLIDRIETVLDTLGRPDSAFDNWYKKKYQTNAGWRQADIQLKRDLLTSLEAYLPKTQAA